MVATTKETLENQYSPVPATGISKGDVCNCQENINRCKRNRNVVPIEIPPSHTDVRTSVAHDATDRPPNTNHVAAAIPLISGDHWESYAQNEFLTKKMKGDKRNGTENR